MEDPERRFAVPAVLRESVALADLRDAPVPKELKEETVVMDALERQFVDLAALAALRVRMDATVALEREVLVARVDLRAVTVVMEREALRANAVVMVM